MGSQIIVEYMNEYWTDKEIKSLDSAPTFYELGDIALTILQRMKKVGKPIVQICGPMSTGGRGNLEENMKFFGQTVQIATNKGLTVFNQMPFQDAMIRIAKWKPGDAYAEDILEIFYRKIFESGLLDEVLFLPDWQSSRGARWERDIAVKLNIPIKEFPVEWLGEKV